MLILHQSGHLASVNHKALELLGINEKSSNPSGGVIRRVVGTNIPNGVLNQKAAYVFFIKNLGVSLVPSV